MSEAFFSPVDGDRFAGGAVCGGPWSPELMHGGPPSALLVRACERAAEGAVPGLVALRTSIEFIAAVPVGEVEVSAAVVRAGRRVTLTEAALRAGGREVLYARTWHLRLASDPTPALGQGPPAAYPPPAGIAEGFARWTFPYATALEWRLVSGDADGPGDAAVWSRARIPVVAGEEPSGLQRAVLSGDSASGVSARLSWDAWSFVNIDLDVHLSRPLTGEWVLMDARTRYEPVGTALAESVLADERGRVGRSAQTLVVAPRQERADTAR